MAYSPPVTEIAAAEVIPATVMVLEVIWVETATSVWSVKENASGSRSVSQPPKARSKTSELDSP